MNATAMAIFIIVALIVGLCFGADYPTSARGIAGGAALVVLVLVGVLIGGAM